MERIRILRRYKIEPYVVFDGGHLPAKMGTESSRKRKRDEHLSQAKALEAQGKHSMAREHYVKCLDVTPQMAYQLIKVRVIFLRSDFHAKPSCRHLNPKPYNMLWHHTKPTPNWRS